MDSRKNTIKALSIPQQDLQVIIKESEVPIFGLTTVNLEKLLKNRRSVPKNSNLSKSMSVSHLFNKNPAKTVAVFKNIPKSPKKFSTIDWNDFLKRKN